MAFPIWREKVKQEVTPHLKNPGSIQSMHVGGGAQPKPTTTQTETREWHSSLVEMDIRAWERFGIRGISYHLTNNYFTEFLLSMKIND